MIFTKKTAHFRHLKKKRVTIHPTDGQTDRPTDTTSYRDARTLLKIIFFHLYFSVFRCVLYKRVCLSVGPSVHLLIGRSVRNRLFSKLKNRGFPSCLLSVRIVFLCDWAVHCDNPDHTERRKKGCCRGYTG